MSKVKAISIGTGAQLSQLARTGAKVWSLPGTFSPEALDTSLVVGVIISAKPVKR